MPREIKIQQCPLILSLQINMDASGSTETAETTANNSTTNTTPSDQTEQEPSPTASQNNPSKPYANNYLRISKENVYMVIALWMEGFPESSSKDGEASSVEGAEGSSNTGEASSGEGAEGSSNTGEASSGEGAEGSSHTGEASSQSPHKVGAVLVLPNDIIYAADCSRGGVHAVQRLLMKHYDKAEGSKMFLSRKPCPTCVKLLVQARVQRVLFLPFEPEYYPSPDRDAQRQQVDNLFNASAIAQTKFVLEIDESVLTRAVTNTPKTPETVTDQVEREKQKLIEKYR
jgi:pyrimidine deaminase RibD-like protein